MPAIITKGGMSASGFGFGASAQGPVYIEDVFNTWIYRGTGSALTVNNGIDLSTKGGVVWVKPRSGTFGSDNHHIFDTIRGVNNFIASNLVNGNDVKANTVTSFLSNGFVSGTYFGDTGTNYAAWTFRKQPKFFTCLTYTGTGSATNIPHDLGSVPGMIIVKSTSATGDWIVSHRSLASASNSYLFLNTTAASANVSGLWNTGPTSTTFGVGTGTSNNVLGVTYVAYLFAHDAGGFGATGTDNVVSCGSFTGAGSTPVNVNLGWEAQYVIVKRTDSSQPWYIFDNMRGMSETSDQYLSANTPSAEGTDSPAWMTATATGFKAANWTAGGTWIYLAIRRGPMKTPTNATTVFSPITSSAATGTKLTTNFPVDLQIFSARTLTTNKGQTVDRLRGISSNTTESGTQLVTTSTAAETTTNTPTLYWDNTGFQMPSIYSGNSMVFWNFGRAPGFMDVVCYTGTGSAMTITHGLGVVPEMIITKSRSASGLWAVYHQFTGPQNYLQLSTTARAIGYAQYYTTAPTSTSYTQGTDPEVTGSGRTFVVYLFASCPGVSKVGSYTGTGAAQNINCDFAAAARFVLIKRTDTTGDWWCYDSARGITAANDPYLFWNSNAAEVTSTDYVNAFATGFGLTSTAPAGLNANGGTYIYLAIA